MGERCRDRAAGGAGGPVVHQTCRRGLDSASDTNIRVRWCTAELHQNCEQEADSVW